ncbi:MAG: dehydratase [Aeromicrobium sp.]|nr:dehydratase [Aeromicrobium sp.]
MTEDWFRNTESRAQVGINRSVTGYERTSVGQHVSFAKTVSESDVYLFAGLTGDLADLHVNADAMSKSSYGQRIAHGVLTVGLMSTASTRMIDLVGGRVVSYGYDRIRFVGPVFLGDTVTIAYTIAERLDEKRQTVAKVEATNQRGEMVAVAHHILQFLDH